MKVYVGSVTDNTGSDGLYVFDFDTEKGTFQKVESYPEISHNPVFMAVAPERLYVVMEIEKEGYIYSFCRDKETGKLAYLNDVPVNDKAMCHVTVLPGGKALSTANYRAGNLRSHRLNPDGSVGEQVSFFQNEGHGYDVADRQTQPHVHSTTVSPDGKQLFVADLGLDKVFVYNIGENGALCPASEEEQIVAPPGEGPRHLTFNDDGSRLYVLTEMGSNVLVYQKTGTGYKQMQIISALPEDFSGENTAADIHLSKDGKYLYASNRGKDCITVYSVEENGRLGLIDFCDAYGKCPRNFCITPDDRYVLIANQFSNNIVSCPRLENGLLGAPTDQVIVPAGTFITAVE